MGIVGGSAGGRGGAKRGKQTPPAEADLGRVASRRGKQPLPLPQFCYVVKIGKRSPKWWWLKDNEGKSPKK